MTVSEAAGEHQRRANTSAQQVLVLELEFELEHTDRRRLEQAKEKGAVLGFFTLSNQFKQMKPH